MRSTNLPAPKHVPGGIAPQSGGYVNYYPAATSDTSHTVSSGTDWVYYPNDTTITVGYPDSSSIKLGGKGLNKIDWDLSRFTLIKRLKFLYNLIFKGKATMEVDPKLVKLEKALEVLKNAK